MAETKDDIAAERDTLKAENEQLKARLAATGATRPYAPSQRFQLSEGDRQELVANGRVNVGGVLLNRDQVRAKLDDNQRNIDLGEGDAPDATAVQPNRGTPGVDFVYPSVAPGEIDPAVAGTPGINGPAAGEGE